MQASAWDLAVESVEEALGSHAGGSLARLGRLGQVGSLPSFIAALADDDNPAPHAFAHARERESLGFAPREIAAELLAVGRVLDRRGAPDARASVDRCVERYVEWVTDELAEQARRDPLTGVLNQLAFHTLVEKEVARARRYRSQLALVVFDLDNFKQTNDRDGHQEGDRLLRAFAAALRGTVRESDAVGRIGGDEFAVLLVQGDERAVRAFLRRLHAELPGGVATSAGAAYLADGCATSEQLFGLADRRLYGDKSARAA